MRKILLIDDEVRMLDLLSLYLSPVGYHCVKVKSGSEAITLLSNEKFDLVLLDIMMPKMDGWETCDKIRQFSDVPIIMVTARDQKTEIIKGLQIGADDYITKPLDEDELLARIGAILRRHPENNHITFQAIQLDRKQHLVSVYHELLSLTPIEFGLLELFLTNQNMIFSREHLIEKIWGLSSRTEDRTVDSHIRNLRDKLRQKSFPVDDFLKTIYGVGYKWQI